MKVFSRLLPNRAKGAIHHIIYVLNVFPSFIKDAKDYVRASSHWPSKSKQQLLAQIISHYHSLEKGLTMPNRKSVFGIEVAQDLVRLLRQWDVENFGKHEQVHAAKSVLRSWVVAVSRDSLESIQWIGEYQNLKKEPGVEVNISD